LKPGGFKLRVNLYSPPTSASATSCSFSDVCLGAAAGLERGFAVLSDALPLSFASLFELRSARFSTGSGAREYERGMGGQDVGQFAASSGFVPHFYFFAFFSPFWLGFWIFYLSRKNETAAEVRRECDAAADQPRRHQRIRR
jgi:hypothetical protein